MQVDVNFQILGYMYVTLAVVDSIKERCLQWIGWEGKLTLNLILNPNPNPNPNPKHYP